MNDNLRETAMEQLSHALDTLTEREAKVIELRFGLSDGRRRTLKETGKEFNFTEEQIQEVESTALRKLRHPSRSKNLSVFNEWITKENLDD